MNNLQNENLEKTSGSALYLKVFLLLNEAKQQLTVVEITNKIYDKYPVYSFDNLKQRIRRCLKDLERSGEVKKSKCFTDDRLRILFLYSIKNKKSITDVTKAVVKTTHQDNQATISNEIATKNSGTPFF